MDKKSVVDVFREKTEQCFHNIYWWTPAEVEAIVTESIQELLVREGLDKEITLTDLIITGTRCRGIEQEDSDLDILLEYESDTWREDSFFNLLHKKENEIVIEGVLVDVNPIHPEKSGTIEDVLPSMERYLEEKEEVLNQALLKRAEELDVSLGCFPMVIENVISLPAEYDDYLSEHEQRRLTEILEKKLQERKPSLDENIQHAESRVWKGQPEDKRDKEIEKISL